MLNGCSSNNVDIKPPDFKLKAVTLAKAIKSKGNQRIPLDSTTMFSSDDDVAVAIVEYDNLFANHDFRWEWIDPKGKPYMVTGKHEVKIPSGDYIEYGSTWHQIAIKGERASRLPGNWKVNIFMDDQLLSSNSFIIEKKFDPNDLEGIPDFDVDVDSNIPLAKMKKDDAIAVVIGNKNYKHSDISLVKYAHRDAEITKEYMIRTLGIPRRNVFFQKDLSKADFERLFGTFGDHKGKLCRSTKPGSPIFIYYSGHAEADPNTNSVFLLPMDRNPASIAFNGYPLDLFYKNLSKINSQKIIVILEACYSGVEYKASNIVARGLKIPEAPNITTLTSSQSNQISKWLDDKNHGMFTYFFLKALRGHADKNKDQNVDLHEIYDYVSDKTTGVPFWSGRLFNREQIPGLKGSKKDFTIVSDINQ